MSLTEESARAHLARLAEAYRHQRVELTALTGLLDGMSALTEAADAAGKSADIHTILDEVVERARTMLDAEGGAVLSEDDTAKELVFLTTVGGGDADALRWRRVPRHRSVAGWVLSNKRSTIVNSPYSDERFHKPIDAETDFRTRCIVAAPMLGAGQCLGVLEIINKNEGKMFSVRDEKLLSVFARFAGELLVGLLSHHDGDRSLIELTGSQKRVAVGR